MSSKTDKTSDLFFLENKKQQQQKTMFLLVKTIIEPPHGKANKMASMLSEDSDQPEHPPSLISLLCPHEECMGP